MDFIYTNTRGETLEIGGNSIYRYGDTDLLDSTISYTVSGVNVTDLHHEARESTLTVYVEAQTEAAGLAARDHLAEILDTDVGAGELGTLRVGEWYTRCLCVSRRKDNWWFDGRYFEAELSLLRPDPIWIHETTSEFLPAGSQPQSGWLDFPFDFPFDFSPNPSTHKLRLNSVMPCDWLITIYGPATDPYVAIGSNKYQVNVTVPPDGLLLIDSRTWSIIVRDIDGNEVDVFDNRICGDEGSGEYMWAPIKPGTSVVSWDNSFGWDLTVFAERNEPPCT